MPHPTPTMRRGWELNIFHTPECNSVFVHKMHGQALY